MPIRSTRAPLSFSPSHTHTHTLSLPHPSQLPISPHPCTPAADSPRLQALRDVREVHPAWEHRLPPAETTALRLAASVDLRGLGSRHVAGRALFAVVMVLAAALMHAVMLRLAAAGLAV